MKKPIITYLDKSFELFIEEKKIQERIKYLCQRIESDYSNPPLFIGILNGAFRFAADVFKYLKSDVSISFIKIKSYVGDQRGTLKELIGLTDDIEGKDIILIEDIVDSGSTLHHIIPQLEEKKPASIQIMSLLTKPAMIQYDLPLKYVGFAVPNNFLIGYGLDINEQARQLNDIYSAIENTEQQ